MLVVSVEEHNKVLKRNKKLKEDLVGLGYLKRGAWISNRCLEKGSFTLVSGKKFVSVEWLEKLMKDIDDEDLWCKACQTNNCYHIKMERVISAVRKQSRREEVISCTKK